MGRVIGALPTVCLLLAISLVGAWLAKSQGLRGRSRQSVTNSPRGGSPAARLLDGAMIARRWYPADHSRIFLATFLGLFFLPQEQKRAQKMAWGGALERGPSKGTIIIDQR
ncbi:MAG: FxsA family protein [Desulfobacterales bacterium]|nr:FxsA family protein [Desulfobacterales bacterium]